MNLMIFPDPPSPGKTSVVLRAIVALRNRDIKVGVVKFDCLYTDDNVAYEKAGVPIKEGLSGALCPDHFFASNIEEVVRWDSRIDLDLLISESVGLCNRCSPYLKDIKDTCVVDNLSGINTPKRIGLLSKSVNAVVITKSDIVSQTECEVLASRVSSVNPRAVVMYANSLADQGVYELGTPAHDESKHIDLVQGVQLRFPIPAALCPYYLGETRIGGNCQLGSVKKMDLGKDPA